MYSWGVGTPQSDPNLKKNNFFLIKALRWFLILFLYFVHFVVATKVFGMQHFSLFLSLWACMCYTCVSIPGFKSMLCFIFYHSLWEIECAVHIVGCLPSICSPPPPQQSLISIWESGVPEMLILLPFPDLVTILLESLAFDCSFSHSE